MDSAHRPQFAGLVKQEGSRTEPWDTTFRGQGRREQGSGTETWKVVAREVIEKQGKCGVMSKRWGNIWW